MLENDPPDDISLPSGTSTDSFLDNSSAIFSVDDELQQDLYGEFDVGDDASDEDSSSSDEEETIWTEEELVGAKFGQFRKAEDTYPKFNPPQPPEPVNIPPSTSFPVDFFHLYFNISIMENLVTCTNGFGENFFYPKANPLMGPIGPVGHQQLLGSYIASLAFFCTWD